MSSVRMFGLIATGCLCWVSFTGCVMPPVENEVTWAIKAAQQRLTETTVKEWQALAEKIDAAVAEMDISLTEEQAQAIIDFLKQYNLNGVDDILAFIDDVESGAIEVEDIEIPQSLLDLFGNPDARNEFFGNLGG